MLIVNRIVNLNHESVVERESEWTVVGEGGLASIRRLLFRRTLLRFIHYYLKLTTSTYWTFRLYRYCAISLATTAKQRTDGQYKILHVAPRVLCCREEQHATKGKINQLIVAIVVAVNFSWIVLKVGKTS